MSRPNISIIIVSWNVAADLKKCLAALFRSRRVSCEVIVIDNHSSDSSLAIIQQAREHAPQNIRLVAIANTENRGFAAANNQGLKIATGEYILLLNPDTEIFPTTLDQMRRFFQSHPDAAVAGCRLLNTDGTLQPSVRSFPTLWSQFFVMLKLHHLAPMLPVSRHYFALDFDYAKTQRVDQVMGAFFMLPKLTFERVGWLDEKFFIWFEEVDYCKRVKNLGLSVYYVADAKCVHHGGHSFQQVFSFSKQILFNRSMRYYFKKHGNFFMVLALWACWPASLLLSFIAGALNKQKA